MGKRFPFVERLPTIVVNHGQTTDGKQVLVTQHWTEFRILFGADDS
jgi:hypothetical protein